jgi:hypothetical protein
MAAPTRPVLALVLQAPTSRAAAYRIVLRHLWCQHQATRVLPTRLWFRLHPVDLETLHPRESCFHPMVVLQIENVARIKYAVAARVPGPTLGQYPRSDGLVPRHPLVLTASGECPLPFPQQVTTILLVPSLGVESQRRLPLSQWRLRRSTRLLPHRLRHYQSLWDHHTRSCHLDLFRWQYPQHHRLRLRLQRY